MEAQLSPQREPTSSKYSNKTNEKSPSPDKVVPSAKISPADFEIEQQTSTSPSTPQIGERIPGEMSAFQEPSSPQALTTPEAAPRDRPAITTPIEEKASPETEEPLRAYQDPHLEACAEAEREFEQREAPIFDKIAQQLGEAREQARVAELKSQEAAVEAAEWVSTRRDVRTELAVAKACIEKAQAIIEKTEQLVEKAEQTQEELQAAEEQAEELTAARAPEPATPGADEGAVWQAKLAEDLTAEALELENAARTRRQHMADLADAAERVESLAEERAAALKELEAKEHAIRETSAALDATAEKELLNAEHDLQLAVQRHDLDIQHAANAPSHEALEVQWMAYAERASVKATGAELAVGNAVMSAVAVEQADSATTQARRDTELLARRAGELVSYAEALQQGSQSLMERAYEKACEAREACSVVSPTGAPGATATTGGGGGGVSGTTEQHELQQKYESVIQQVNASRDHAKELLEEARKHARAGNILKREAAKHAEHVERVLHDAAVAQAKEEAALLRVEDLAEGARTATGSAMAQTWAGLSEDNEFKEAAHTAGLL